MNAPVSHQRISACLDTATNGLLNELEPAGHWTGRLSSSALSTATALIALAQLQFKTGDTHDQQLIQSGLQWLAANQNPDGGWGDTDCSHSNISTTALCWAAFGATETDLQFSTVVHRSVRWLQRAAGSDSIGWEQRLAEAIRKRYGKDKTFSVPILTACILSGRFGADGWREVSPLPFELAALPHNFYGALRLPVVSYALPALIAIGRSIHHHAPCKNMLLRGLRTILEPRTANKLEQIQPDNGGFLEATPLTSFVLMNLAAIGETRSHTALKAASFLRSSVRPDGSWPIDTNLSTWLTTWAVVALSKQKNALSESHRSKLKKWLLDQQHTVVHPYTNAAPGGWSWTNLPGGVPDADDTPGALLALLALGSIGPAEIAAAELGTCWLLDLQNRDGGMPTFCRGWGTLPFDRSGADLTAHALRAWLAWQPYWKDSLRQRVTDAIQKGVLFLQNTQRSDGTWTPLWFGNQNTASEENLTWGTARVILALKELQYNGHAVPERMIANAENALVSLQQMDGGWSGGYESMLQSSVEETAVALEALSQTGHLDCLDRGVRWLLERVETGTWTKVSPIGFYFAKLWYYERLYPQLTTVAALGAILGAMQPHSEIVPEANNPMPL